MPKGPEQYAPPEGEEKISLRDILTFDNPKIAEYQALINHFVDNARAPSQPRTMHWGEIFFGNTTFPEYDRQAFKSDELGSEKVRVYLKEKLAGGTLVDLGGGTEEALVMRAIARMCDVHTYLSVDIQGPDFKPWPRFYDYVPPYEKLIKQHPRWDPYVGRRFKPLPEISYLPQEVRKKPIDEYIVTSDMLDFVARLPDNSSNFVANGIDFLTSCDEGYDYRENLLREIVRAMRQGGVLFGVSQELGPFGLHKFSDQLKDKPSEFGYGDAMIVEKMTET